MRFDSPALDAGHSGGLTTDQRGLPRPIDDQNTSNIAGGDGSDIGAYEADPRLCISMAKRGEDIGLGFNSILGRTYRLDNTTDLTQPWKPLITEVPGTGGPVQTIDVGGAVFPQRFYRAVQLP